ncbi:MAG TPA: glucosamine-6-phosphate deaminase [Chloroflexota bacterium]
MRVRVVAVEDYRALSIAGAEAIAEVIGAKPSAALAVATGNTPLGAYDELAGRHRRGELPTARLRVFQLDDYVGVRPDDPRSLYGWMKRAFVDPLGVPPERVVRLAGDATDPEAACAAYARAVRDAGGLDLAILGLGPNGHLGFNEPPCEASAPTRVVTLTEESVVSSAGYWGSREVVPTRGVTAGMDLLLAARRILLLVSGAPKREILRRTLLEPPTGALPASHLQRAADVLVLADRAALPEELSAGKPES